MGRLRMKTDVCDAVSNADVVVEAISENLKVKQKVFAELDKISPR